MTELEKKLQERRKKNGILSGGNTPAAPVVQEQKSNLTPLRVKRNERLQALQQKIGGTAGVNTPVKKGAQTSAEKKFTPTAVGLDLAGQRKEYETAKTMDTAAAQKKRDALNARADEIAEEAKAYKAEMDFFASGTEQGPRYTAAKAKWEELNAQATNLRRSGTAQEQIDQARELQTYLRNKPMEEAERQRLMTMDIQEAEAKAEQVERLRQLQQAAKDKMDLYASGDKFNQGEGYLAAKEEYDTITRQIEAMGTGYDWETIDKAVDLQNRAKMEQASRYVDFAVRSKYRPTKQGSATGADGWGDLQYEVINGNQTAINMAYGNGITNEGASGVAFSAIENMTPEEVATYNYYYSVSGRARADEYLKLLESDLNARQMEKQIAWFEQYANEHPYQASFFTIATSPAGGISYVLQGADLLADGKIDENKSYNTLSQVNTAIRDKVGQKVEKNWGKAGSFGYNVAMSMGDFLVAAGLSGGTAGVASAILGTNAAAQTTIEAKQRGLSDGRAFALGTVAGAAELITEKYSLETLLDATALGKSTMGYWLQNVLSEGSEEAASNLANFMADMLISGDKAEARQLYNEYKKNYDDRSAAQMVLLNQMTSLGLDALAGAVSGGVMAGAGIGVNAAGTALDNRRAEQTKEKVARFAQGQQNAAPTVQEEMDEKEAALDRLFDAGVITNEMYQIGVDQIEGEGADALAREGLAAAQPGKVQNQQTGTNEKVRAKNVSTKRLRLTAERVGLDKKTERQYRKLSRATGTQIEFYSHKDKAQNGYMDHKTGIVHVNVNGTKAWAWTLGHEITHTLQQTNTYRQLSVMALRSMQEAGLDIEAMLQNKVRVHNEHGDNIDMRGAAYELVADWAADNLFTSEKAVMDLVRGDRSLGQKILDWITGLLQKIRGGQQGEDTEQLRFLQRARGLYAKALNERNNLTAPQTKTAQAATQTATRQTTQQTAQTQKEPKKKSAEKAAQDEAVERQQARADELKRAQEQLDAAYAAGEVTEEEYNAQYDLITSQPEWQERSFSITDPEEQAKAMADLRKLMSGEMRLKEYNRSLGRRATPTVERDDGLSQEARNIKNAARRQNISVQEYLHRNWELFDVDGEWNAAAREALDSERGRSYTEPVSSGRSYSISPEYEEDVQRWYNNEMPENEQFVLGSTGDVLQGLGAIESDIFIEGDKIKTIFDDHPEMTIDVVKKIPQILEDPALILKSNNKGRGYGNSRLVIFGSVKGEDGRPVMCVLDLRPIENGLLLDDLQQVTSAYTKDNDPVGFIKKSEVMYADKKRTIPLLRSVGFPRPSVLLRNGYIGSIDYDGDFVKLNGAPFEEVVSEAEDGGVSYSFTDDGAETQEQTERAAVSRETLTAKAAGKLAGVEREMTNEIKKVMSVPKLVKWNAANEIARMAADEYLATGDIQKNTINDAVHEAITSRIEAVRAFLEQYQKVERYLNNTAFTVEEGYRKELGDWEKFVETNKEALPHLQTENGFEVGKAFDELHEMAPELFTEYVTRPPQQIRKMVEVAKNLQKARAIVEETDAMSQKELVKNEEQLAKEVRKIVNQRKKDINLVKRYAEDRASRATDEIEIPETEEEAAPLFERRRVAQRELQKVRAKNLLTADDEAQISDMLKGKRTEKTLEKGSNKEGIKAVYKAEKEYRDVCRILDAYKNRRQQTDNAEADKLLETAGTWKDKPRVSTMAEIQERNILDIVPDKKLAQRIIDTYFTPVHEHEAQRIRFVNEYVERVKKLGLGQTPKDGNENSESFAVQFVGETEYIISELEQSKVLGAMYGKTLKEWQSELDAFWRANPNMDRTKIDNAIKEFHKIYDELLPMMNEVRVRNGYEPVPYRKGYFPHFSKNEQDGIISAFMKATGIKSSETVELPTSINGLTHAFKPRIRWFAHAQERTGNKTDFDALEGFERYLNVISDVIYHTDDIRKLRTFAARIRYRTTDQGIRDRDDQIRQNPNMSDEDKDDLLKQLYDKEAKYELKNYVVDLDDYINQLAGKKSDIDRFLERIMGRQVFAVGDAIDRALGANMVGASVRSALSNLVALPQGAAELKTRHFINGMADTMKSWREDDGFVYQSTFLTNRRGMEKIVQTMTQKASDKTGVFFEIVDHFVSDTLVRARVKQNMEEGLTYSQAMREADAWGAKVLGDRSKGAMPTLFGARNPIARVVTKFQLEVNNTPRHVWKDIIKNPDGKSKAWIAAVLLKYAIGAWLMDEILQVLVGDKIGLNPLNVGNELVGDLTGYEFPDLYEAMKQLVTTGKVDFTTEKGDAVQNLANNILDQTPFTGVLSMTSIDERLGLDFDGGRIPLESALPDIGGLISTWGNESNSLKKKLRETADEAIKPIFYLAMPFGGGQLKKSLQGLEAAVRGGKFALDAEGNKKLQYPLYNETLAETVLNDVQAVLFGPSSTKGGQEWIESGFKTLSVDETAAYLDMLIEGVERNEAYDLIQQLRSAEKTEDMTAAEVKRQILRDSTINDAAKGVVYKAMFTSDKEKKLLEELEETNQDIGSIGEMLMTVKDAKNSNEKRDAILKANLTDKERKTAYQYIFGTEQEDKTYASSRDDDIEAFQKAGLKMEDFLKIQNQYTTINEQYKKSSDKATAFSRWLNTQGLTSKQKQTVTESFKYFSQLPADGGNYDKMVSAGLSDKKAYDVYEALSALEPEEGKKSVTDRQRLYAIAEENLTDDETMKAFEVVASESEMAKIRAGYELYLSPKLYASVKYTMPEYDADGNGSYTQKEVQAAIDAYKKTHPKWSAGTDAILWQMLTGSTSAKSNPYSVTVGETYLKYLNEQKQQVK